MTLHAWLAFASASAILGLVPGPGVLSIVGYAIGAGQRVALASVAGMMVGNGLAMTLSLIGVGALLATSALAFLVLKWAGALYLVGLGLVALARSGRAAAIGSDQAGPVGARAAFLGNMLVGTFHPKTIVFFVAFAPQFIRPEAGYGQQAALLVLTFCGIVGITDTGYALAAARAARLLSTPRAHVWSRRAGGGALVASGLATALQR